MYLRTKSSWIVAAGLLCTFISCADGTGPTDETPLAFQLLTIGSFHTCGLTLEGKAYCWGENLYGQLGDGTNINRALPVAVAGNLTFKTLDAGGAHTCALTTDGITYCWGSNARAQLGDGTTDNRSVPVRVSGDVNLVSLSLGGGYSCGLTAGGSAYCWGANAQGQFGNDLELVSGACAQMPDVIRGVHPYCWRPVPAVHGLALRTIEPGSFHACGLTLEGRVYCWGENTFGELGTGSQDDHLTAFPVASDLSFPELAGGATYACALTIEGIPHCWGALPWKALQEKGLLYQGSTPSAVDAQQQPFKSVSVGYEVACGLTAGGEAWCWGDNVYGQMGQSTTGPYRWVPEPILGDLKFKSLVAGYRRVCGLTTSGAAFCWGQNNEGQLGDGSNSDRSLPVAVLGPKAGS